MPMIGVRRFEFLDVSVLFRNDCNLGVGKGWNALMRKGRSLLRIRDFIMVNTTTKISVKK